jgi:RNA recognition motif-containing protein
MRLYVGNLSFDTTEGDLQEAFARFGTVSDSKIVTDHQTGNSRGFGFVTMGGSAEGQAAITGLNGADLGGRTLNVNEARPRDDNGGGAGAPRKSFEKRGGGDRGYAGNRR